MDRNTVYYRQVQLLLQVLPFIAKYSCFALKGGTAINLFIRDMPRLSVDIDLVYLPNKDRQTSIKASQNALNNISAELKQAFPKIQITPSYKDKTDALRLIVTQHTISVKVELSPVLRGTVFQPSLRTTTKTVEDEFGFAETNVVSLEDLYAGKLCAAFDRQHPRDFFDVLLLLENEGITSQIRQAFLVYLISHQRPMHEILRPRWRSIEPVFNSEFHGMTARKTNIDELTNAARQALDWLHDGFTTNEKEFLCSLYSKQPAWDTLPFPHIRELPAVKWKLKNINKMHKEKKLEAIADLKNALNH